MLTPDNYATLHAFARKLMKHERSNHTLQPTALVNELYLRLMKDSRTENSGENPFTFSFTMRAMKQILIDHARHRNAQKGPGTHVISPLDHVIDRLEERDQTSIFDFMEALGTLAETCRQQAEIVEARVLLGMDIREISDAMGVSESTVKRQWQMARIKLFGLLNVEQKPVALSDHGE